MKSPYLVAVVFRFLVCALVLAVVGHSNAASATVAAWTPVPPPDLGRLSPADFRDEELSLIPAFANFHRVANAVVEHGETRGYIALQIWRAPEDNHPHNARIMESLLTLAWFYTADRPWNMYRGHPAVRVRLEAGIDFLVRQQHADGTFSEYAPGQRSLAATAFMTKFFGEALLLLERGPAIDPVVWERAVAMHRRAVHAVLTLPDLFSHGRIYSNQYGNVWPGGLMQLALRPDPALRALWERQWHASLREFQSPAGFFYEADGPDFGYTLSTHRTNSLSAWPYVKGTPLAAELLAKEADWLEWLSYNALPEPDGKYFFLNRAIETRQRHIGFARHDTDIAAVLPLARAYATTPEEWRKQVETERARLARAWPEVSTLRVGEFWALTPYLFLHLRQEGYWPTEAERAAAQASLPWRARERFNHMRTDSRHASSYFYFRRPAYYAALAAGSPVTAKQRFGLGLIWRPEIGTVWQSQSMSDDGAWGTIPESTRAPLESVRVPFTLTADGVGVSVAAGNQDFDGARCQLAYALADRGRKRVLFADEGIDVEIDYAGLFREQIPLLLRVGEKIAVEGREVRLMHANGAETRLVFDGGEKPTVHEMRVGEGRGDEGCPPVRLQVVRVSAQDRLGYRIQFLPSLAK
jgi:hypothetical protein